MSSIYLSENNLSFNSKSYKFKLKSLKGSQSTSVKYVLKYDDDLKLNLRKFKQLVSENLVRACNCDYDCCGHWFTTHWNINRKTKNKFEVELFHAQNY